MMGDTVRITRECTLEGLSPELGAAIRGRMTADDATISMCCETESTIVRRRMFGRRQVTTTTGMIVTPRHLIWAVAAEGEVSAMSARLRDLEVHDYETGDQFRLVPDSGLSIDGLRSDLPGQPASAFIAVGPEPAGAKFRRTLRQAIADANLLP